MSVSKDIPVEVVSEAKSNVKVVVFTKNDGAPESYYCAWQILNVSPSTTEKFVYPAETSIDARWSGKSLHPVPAKPGSTLEILNPEEESTPVLQQAISAPPNPVNAITVKNVKPTSWSGRMFDIGVYKNNKLLMSQQQISVGNQAVFMLKPKLHFGVARSDKFIPQMFGSSEIAESSDALESFDLDRYPNGLKVTLKEGADGRFTFTGENI